MCLVCLTVCAAMDFGDIARIRLEREDHYIVHIPIFYYTEFYKYIVIVTAVHLQVIP